MDPGHRPGRGTGPPWIYRSISGEYACLEKHFATELWPARSPGPCTRQDPPWSKALPLRPLPSGCDPRDLQHLGKGAGGDQAVPHKRKPRGSSESRRHLGWAAPPERLGQGAWTGCAGGRQLAEGPLPAGPPSYETHMLRRLRAGPAGHKPSERQPPPYISPPAYDGPHRTLPAKRPRATPKPPAAKRGRAAPPRKSPPTGSLDPTHSSGIPCQWLPRPPRELLGGWTYHAGSGSLGRCTGGGPTCPRLGGAARCPARGHSAESLFCPLPSLAGGSHTLPRATGGTAKAPGWDAAGPISAPGWQRLPMGWGFGYAPSPAGGARSRPVEGGGPRGREGRGAPPSPRPMPKAPSQRPPAKGRSQAGGVFVIDATCVVIRAEYIPPPQREQVRLLGSPLPRDPASPGHRLPLTHQPHTGNSELAAEPPPTSPGHSSLGEGAASIVGLQAAELGLGEPQGAGVRQEPPKCWGQRAGEVPPGSLEPLTRDSTAHGLPSQAPSPAELPGPLGGRETPMEPLEPGAKPHTEPPGSLGGRETPMRALGVGAKPPTEPGPYCGREAARDNETRALPLPAQPCAQRPASCARDLREAVSRIRRHTAPDSDTDEEPEGLALPSPMAPRAAQAYSSSSGDSSDSEATIIPAGEGGPPGWWRDPA
ncbi:dendrin [Carettochelys insculpta]|uniref:dendrin n=1 Tax=Carettochelys insculpta TaxID=44489 RepID=UPI003EBBB582